MKKRKTKGYLTEDKNGDWIVEIPFEETPPALRRLLEGRPEGEEVFVIPEIDQASVTFSIAGVTFSLECLKKAD